MFFKHALERVTEKWTPKYPNSMKRWKDNWDAISPIFKFSTTVRTVIYTTNAIESLNSTYRKLNRQRSVFPSDTALLKALYLATFEATKKWTSTIRNWALMSLTLKNTSRTAKDSALRGMMWWMRYAMSEKSQLNFWTL